MHRNAGRYGDHGEREVDVFLDSAGIDVIPFTSEQARLARYAYRHFGKGRHPAQLNFGDCFSYALARSLGDELLFVGEDFSHTDVQMVAY